MASYPSQMCVLLTPDDLNINKSPGRLKKDFMFKATFNITPRGGHYTNINGVPGNYIHRFHLIFIYDRHYMKINKDGHVEFRYESGF